MTQEQTPSPADGIKEPTDPIKKSAPGPGEPADPDSQSVAGEEDPGASLDMSGVAPPKPSGATVSMPADSVNPGDEAPEGTPGTGEGLCRDCGGSGRVGNAACPSCRGSGKVIVGIGRA